MRYFFTNLSTKVVGLPDGRIVMPDDEVEIDAKTAELPAVWCYERMKIARVRAEEDAKAPKKVEAKDGKKTDGAKAKGGKKSKEEPKDEETKAE